jgi:hypothetical protein
LLAPGLLAAESGDETLYRPNQQVQEDHRSYPPTC